MLIQGTNQNTMISFVCNTLVQENVGVYNSNSLEVYNLWYAHVPVMMC